MDSKFINYYRVSTSKQGKSGLGLQAQRNIIKSFLRLSDKVVAEYTDVESGKNDDRPKLKIAIEHCKQEGATLLIAKLDRLSRNIGFIFTLRDSGVKFVAADMPEANTMTIGVFATLAQHERELISDRTKKALQALKERGKKLGTPANLNSLAIEKGREIRQRNARTHKANVQAADVIKDKHDKGLSYRQIAEHLNSNGYRTRRSKLFRATTVMRLLKRVTTTK